MFYPSCDPHNICCLLVTLSSPTRQGACPKLNALVARLVHVESDVAPNGEWDAIDFEMSSGRHSVSRRGALDEPATSVGLCSLALCPTCVPDGTHVSTSLDGERFITLLKSLVE